MEYSEASRDTMAAAAALSKMLSQGDGREAFARDPEGAMKEAGFAMEAIPRELGEHLRGMSLDELRVLGEVCERLIESGLYINIPGGGRVCFF
jgi:hypothetical protein